MSDNPKRSDAPASSDPSRNSGGGATDHPWARGDDTPKDVEADGGAGAGAASDKPGHSED